MDEQDYNVTSRIDINGIQDTMEIASTSDIHLASLIRLGQSIERLNETERFDLHKLCLKLGFSSVEEFCYSIRACAHMMTTLALEGDHMMEQLHRHVGCVVHEVGDRIPAANGGEQDGRVIGTWTFLASNIRIVLIACANSMKGKPVRNSHHEQITLN